MYIVREHIIIKFFRGIKNIVTSGDLFKIEWYLLNESLVATYMVI